MGFEEVTLPSDPVLPVLHKTQPVNGHRVGMKTKDISANVQEFKNFNIALYKCRVYSRIKMAFHSYQMKFSKINLWFKQ